jgi:hypothetical protein
VAGVAEHDRLAEPEEVLAARADEVLGGQVVARGLAAKRAGVELRRGDRGAAAQRHEQRDGAQHK